MKRGKGFSVTVWAAVAVGAIGIGVVVAFLAGYFLGHFTGHEKTTTVSAAPVSGVTTETGSAPAGGEGEEATAGGSKEEAPAKKEPPTGEAPAKKAPAKKGPTKREGQGGGAKSGGASEASLAAGKTAFTTNCASCHTLSEAGTTGSVGPNLDELMPGQALVEKQVTNGGGVMPAFGETLSGKEIEEIAEYVSTVAGTGNESLGGQSAG